MLRHMVLHLLAEEPATGYALCTRIQDASGQRPSYGSIYPLLERFAHDGLVTVTRKGKRKIYALTPAGKAALAAATREHCALIDDEMIRIRRMMELMDADPEPMLAMLERARAGEPPLGGITPSMFRFRDTVFRMAQDGRAERHKKEINNLLMEMTKKLERMA